MLRDARPGRASRRRTSPHLSNVGAAGVEGAGGSGGHGRASRSTTPSEARVWRSRGRPGPTAPKTPAAPQAPTRSMGGSRRGRLAGGPPPTGTHSGRGLRRPEHPWGHTATQPHGTPARHNKTARPQWGRAAVAVALGFEPRVAVTPHSISSAAPSAARTRYLTRILYYTLPPRAQIDRACWEQGHTAVQKPGHTTTDNQSHTATGSHTAHETDTTSPFRLIENEMK